MAAFNKRSLGIFWDIENCPIPTKKLTSSVVKRLREFLETRHPECGYPKEFSIACDVYNLGKLIIEALDRSGIYIVHVNNAAKNASDDKLKELIDKFIDAYGNTALYCMYHNRGHKFPTNYTKSQAQRHGCSINL